MLLLFLSVQLVDIRLIVIMCSRTRTL